MKKRIMLRIGLVTILALSLMGCGISAKTEPSPPSSGITPPSSGITVNDLKYEVLNSMPEGFVPSNNRGFTVVEQDNGYVVIIQTGEKPSSGYGIEIESVKDTGGKTEIIVKETEPKPGEMNATVITYPRVAIKIGNNIAPNFVVKNSKGESFNVIGGSTSGNNSASSGNSTLVITEKATGKFIGFADPHTIAVFIDGQEKSFQVNERLAQQIQSLKISDMQKVKIEYTEKDSQLWLLSLEALK